MFWCTDPDVSGLFTNVVRLPDHDVYTDIAEPAEDLEDEVGKLSCC